MPRTDTHTHIYIRYDVYLYIYIICLAPTHNPPQRRQCQWSNVDEHGKGKFRAHFGKCCSCKSNTKSCGLLKIPKSGFGKLNLFSGDDYL